MNEMTDIYRELGKADQQEKQQRRDSASEMFLEAERLAAEYGMELWQCSESHYRLIGPKWSINIYPGNRRIYRNRESRAPHLNLPGKWTLRDVVAAAVKTMKRTRDP